MTAYLENLENSGLSLTIVEAVDAAFVEKVYFSTRSDEFSVLGWAPEQLEMFLRMQFGFQQQSYRAQFPKAEYFIVNYKNERAGRLILDQNESGIRIVDIAVLPEFRGKGIATRVIESLIEDARKAAKKTSLSVLKTNARAFELYKKLGFTVIAEDDLYYSMER